MPFAAFFFLSFFGDARFFFYFRVLLTMSLPLFVLMAYVMPVYAAMPARRYHFISILLSYG